MNDDLQFAPLPEEYDDDRRNLNILSTIQNALNEDLQLNEDAKRTIDQTRKDWEHLWPSFEEAEATTLEELRDVFAQGRLLKSLSARVKELGGTANTLDKRLNSMLAGLKRVGLAEEHRVRIKKNLRQVTKASGFTEAKAKGYTMEEWAATAKVADAICKNPSAFTFNTYNTPFTEQRAKMNRAAIWLTVVAANRISETISIKADEVDQNGFIYYIKKARKYPEEKYQPIPSQCWEHVESYLKVRDSDDDRLFPISSDILTKMARTTMLEAGLIPHNGRLGVHGFRHMFATHSLEKGYGTPEERQHMLGQKSLNAQNPYTRDSGKQAAVERVSEPYHNALVDAAGFTFEWDRTMGDEYYEAMISYGLEFKVPLLPREATGPGRVIWDNQVLHLGKPVCNHNMAVMMPLIDENGVTVQWGIVEIEGTNGAMGKPVRLIVSQRSIGWARPDLNRSPAGPIEAFFDGYRAALEDMGVSPS